MSTEIFGRRKPLFVKGEVIVPAQRNGQQACYTDKWEEMMQLENLD